MKDLLLDKLYIVLALILVLILVYIVGCTNVKPGQFTSGSILDGAGGPAEVEVVQKETSEGDVVVYVPLPDWQHYDLNPSSSHYKEVYGINKFKDKRIVLAFQQVP